MKQLKLFLMAVLTAVCTNGFATDDVDLGTDYAGGNVSAIIPATSSVRFAGGTTSYTVNEGLDTEVVFTVGGGGTCPSSDNKSVYRNTISSNISWAYLSSNQSHYFEASVGNDNKKITALKFNGTSSSTTKIVTAGIVYSDKTPFVESSIVGYATFDLAMCRAGNAGVDIAAIPEGTKSFRVYRQVLISEAAQGIYAIDAGGDIPVGPANENIRLAYVRVTLDDAASASAPTISLNSGSAAQSLYATLSITPVVYKYGGTATSATVEWTGTVGASTPPAGITVTPDADAKTLTIAGTPTEAGAYGYSVTATDDVATTDPPLTGTITVNAVTKKLLAYVTNNATPTDAGDVAVINKLEETYHVVIVLSTATGVNLSPYDAVVLAALPGSGDAGLGQYKTWIKPFVNLKPFMFQSSRWNWAVPNNAISADNTMATAFASINIVSADHPVFAGITGTTVAMATDSKHSAKRILTPINSWIGENGAKATVLATIANAADGTPYSVADAPVIFEFATESVLTDEGGGDRPIAEGVTVAQKNIHIGVSEQTAGFLTDEYLTIVSNAVNYVISDLTTSISPTANGNQSKVIEKICYDLAGRQVSATSKGILIQKSVHEDGSISFRKEIRN
jgi:hypothetical protein